MTLTLPSIEKIFREHFPADQGLLVAEADRVPLVAELRQLFDGDEWETDRHAWWPHKGRVHHLCSFTLKSPDGGYSYTSFHLMLDESSRLTIDYSSQTSAKVGHLDDVASFVRECKRRFERQQALRKRREKVRGFKRAAMVAQLKKLAREEEFDFLTEFTVARVKLWIRVPDDPNVLHLHFSPKRFPEILPRLPEIVRALREAYAAGVSFKVMTRTGLPWRAEWIRYRDLDDPEK